MTRQPIPDESARRHSLDPAHSFIVQAPAGAGKTELLTQRYLVLLAGVDRPEEILAITFTRKAAAEMRARVLDALTRATDATPPEAGHKLRTWELARRARARDAERGWQIEKNPGRLRIQTIDSFCLGLTQQMPLLARFGAPPSIVEDADGLYREAAVATLALLDDAGSGARAIERLLHHLDNDLRRVAGLIADMLKRRDQWLRHVADRRDPRLQRETLELALANVVRDALTDIQRHLPLDCATEIVALLRHAAENLARAQEQSPILLAQRVSSLPPPDADDLDTWLGVAELLLTKDGTWRRSITKKQGFPAKTDGKTAAERTANDSAKQRFGALIEKISGYPEFGRRLHALRGLPPARYSDAQWQVVQALVEVLPLAVAQLTVIFAQQGRVDFTEVAQGALRALGDPDEPTDLLLALDYRLRHVLVDEFQDTSSSQFELLLRLTAGWTPGDGRTLFLVGDPMQSIYRFREAEVGLYLRATHAGVGTVPLQKLTLSANFRSQAGVVEWVNRAFERIFPAHEDIAAGAVRYAPCVAVHPPLPGEAVTLHPFFGDASAEAERVLTLARAAQARDAAGHIAILVRNRGHLAAIAPQLKRAGLSFRAIEIEHLAERQIVQDLLSLTRALLHLAHRPAWLALLRAPWCGLTLADLHALAGDDSRATVWELLNSEERLNSLSADGQARARRLRAVLAEALASRGRADLRRHVEGTWLRLGGPACVREPNELADAEMYFRLLENLADAPADTARITERVGKLFAATDVHADERLQIMTIHKAKGLEFDTVIVPSLGRPPRSENVRLLAWTERARGNDEPDLLLAPVRATGAEDDVISDYLRGLEQTRARHEELRLLYVAATRAKHYLHLLGHVKADTTAQPPVFNEPASGSLLRVLWPVVEPIFAAAFVAGAATTLTHKTTPDWNAVRDIRRLASGWQAPPVPPAVAVELQAPIVAADDSIEFQWVGETARHVGTVVHRWLLRIGADGLSQWDAARLAKSEAAFRTALARLGVPAAELETASTRVRAALVNVLQDERAAWLLGAHPQGRSEYAVSGVLDGRTVSVVLDRTFVDNAGVRWIVDYKTGAHEGGEVERFLDSERLRYAPQLERYARLLARHDPRPVKLGLYFPLLRGWREWQFKQQ